MKRHILFFVSAILLFTSCTIEISVNESSFSGTECYGLWIDGTAAWPVTANSVQTASNQTIFQYRVSDDNFSNFLILNLEGKPSTGYSLQGSLFWTVDGSSHYMENLTFTVEKQESSGKTWLWNSSNSIGVVIRAGV